MRNRRSAFTLVELLVVIGIIAVLISILLPSLSRARAAANSLACLSNLRVMGQALIMYSDQNNGMLPYGYWAGDANGGAADWSALLTGTMGNGENSYAALGTNGRNKLFLDSDTLPGGQLHYSSHPRLMPVISPTVLDRTTNRPFTTYKLYHLKRSSDVVTLMDGAQIINNSGGVVDTFSITR